MCLSVWCVRVCVRYASKIDGGRFTPTNLGLGLIVAYTDIGLQLGKPYLRAAMERDCQAIAGGTRTVPDVVRDCIAEVGGGVEVPSQSLARLTVSPLCRGVAVVTVVAAVDASGVRPLQGTAARAN